jgi:hypothetical protein
MRAPKGIWMSLNGSRLSVTPTRLKLQVDCSWVELESALPEVSLVLRWYAAIFFTRPSSCLICIFLINNSADNS